MYENTFFNDSFRIEFEAGINHSVTTTPTSSVTFYIKIMNVETDLLGLRVNFPPHLLVSKY